MLASVTLTGEHLVQLVGYLPPTLLALAALVTAIKAKREAVRAGEAAVKAARKQVQFALEDAVNGGLLSAPSDSSLRKENNHV